VLQLSSQLMIAASVCNVVLCFVLDNLMQHYVCCCRGQILNRAKQQLAGPAGLAAPAAADALAAAAFLEQLTSQQVGNTACVLTPDPNVILDVQSVPLEPPD
jgi:hypothetical protein